MHTNVADDYSMADDSLNASSNFMVFQAQSEAAKFMVLPAEGFRSHGNAVPPTSATSMHSGCSGNVFWQLWE